MEDVRAVKPKRGETVEQYILRAAEVAAKNVRDAGKQASATMESESANIIGQFIPEPPEDSDSD